MAKKKPDRFIGLDIHKHYGVFIGVDRDQKQVFGPKRVKVQDLRQWSKENLTQQDSVVVEMTTNTWMCYDILLPLVHSVIVVHPPQVALVTQAHVKTDNKAALTLAQLHAAGFLESIWIPDGHTRQLRSLIGQREQMVKLATRTKNRLHAVIHRLGVEEPEGHVFADEKKDWWLGLSENVADRYCIESDLETLKFAQGQVKFIEGAMKKLAAGDDRVTLLVQVPGIRYLTALVILGAIGDISRFPSAKKLVGYAGLGSRVYSSGKRHATGRLTKAGRKELRTAMVQVAHAAARSHPHWQEKLEELKERMSYQKAIVAIARMLLVSIWHILTKGEADIHAVPEKVARHMMQHVMDLGKENREEGKTTQEAVRENLDRLEVGQDLEVVKWSPTRNIQLPPSKIM